MVKRWRDLGGGIVDVDGKCLAELGRSIAEHVGKHRYLRVFDSNYIFTPCRPPGGTDARDDWRQHTGTDLSAGANAVALGWRPWETRYNLRGNECGLATHPNAARRRPWTIPTPSR